MATAFAKDGNEYEPPAIDLMNYLVSGQPDSYISGINETLNPRLLSLYRAAPPEIRKDLQILSGARSLERQQTLWDAAVKKYGSEAAARKWVARPSPNAPHVKGNAVDFKYGSAEAKKWVHDNAKKHGLYFRMGNEPWHIEPVPNWKGTLPFVPPAGMASDPPIPAKMSAGLRTASQNGPALSNGFDSTKPGSDPSSLYAGMLPRGEAGQVLPRLVGTEGNYQVGRVTPNFDRPYEGAYGNRMNQQGRGALLDPRSFSPATPNPSPSSPVTATASATGSVGSSALASAKARLAAAKQAATAAPGAGLTRTQQDAMRAVPASPSTFPARPGVVASNDARSAAPPSTFPARPATIAPNIVPGMVAPSPRPHYEVATARANQAPASIPKTDAERVWETTHFGDPYDMPSVGMPKFADIAVKMAKTPPLPRPRPAPTVPQFIPKTIQVAVDNSPNAIPQGMRLNSGSRDSVAQREAGKASALKLYATKTVMVPNPAYVAPQAQPNPARIEAARLAELRRLAAEQAARQAIAQRSMSSAQRYAVAAAPALRPVNRVEEMVRGNTGGGGFDGRGGGGSLV